MKRSPRKLMYFFLGVAMVLASCSSSIVAVAPDAEPDPTATSETAADETTPAPEPTATTATTVTSVDSAGEADREAVIAILLANVDTGYRAAEGVWTGFSPNDHPVVLAWKNAAGEVTSAIAINHPNPSELGTAESILDDDHSFGSAHHVTDLDDAAQRILVTMRNFEFSTVIGGTDSFLMNLDGGDQFFNPTAIDYVSTLIHEMFHRYQITNFAPPGFQNIEGYAYTPENIELATLEDRALTAALSADNASDRETAARHFAALRLARLAADPRVSLDSEQEIGEGTARYIEHRVAGDNSAFYYHEGNYGDELFADPNDAFRVKGHFGFGRWYASGAAILKVIDDLGGENVAARVEKGEPPAAILADILGVTGADVEALVADARLNHDPEGEVPAMAAEAAATASGEGPVFGGDDPNEPTDTDYESDAEGEGVLITDAQAACFEANGFDLATGTEISEEIWQECVG